MLNECKKWRAGGEAFFRGGNWLGGQHVRPTLNLSDLCWEVHVASIKINIKVIIKVIT